MRKLELKKGDIAFTKDGHKGVVTDKEKRKVVLNGKFKYYYGEIIRAIFKGER